MKKLGLTFLDLAMLGIVSMLCGFAFITLSIALTCYMVKIKLLLQPIARRAFDRGANGCAAVKAWFKRQKESKVLRKTIN